MAPVPSWITIRRPDVSSRVAGIVLTPTTETVRSLSETARAIVTLSGCPGAGARRLGGSWRRRRRRDQGHVPAIAQPEPIAIERALVRGALPDDAGEAIPCAGSEVGADDPARGGDEDPGSLAGGVDEPCGETGRGLRRRSVDRPGQGPEPTLGRLAEVGRAQASRGGLARPARGGNDAAERDPELQLTVRIGERARTRAGGCRGRWRDAGRQPDEDPARLVAERQQHRAARSARPRESRSRRRSRSSRARRPARRRSAAPSRRANPTGSAHRSVRSSVSGRADRLDRLMGSAGHWVTDRRRRRGSVLRVAVGLASRRALEREVARPGHRQPVAGRTRSGRVSLTDDPTTVARSPAARVGSPERRRHDDRPELTGPVVEEQAETVGECRSGPPRSCRWP